MIAMAEHEPGHDATTGEDDAEEDEEPPDPDEPVDTGSDDGEDAESESDDGGEDDPPDPDEPVDTGNESEDEEEDAAGGEGDEESSPGGGPVAPPGGASGDVSVNVSNGSDSGNESTDPNESGGGNETAAGSGSGGGGGGGFSMPSAPSLPTPQEQYEGLMEAMEEDADQFVERYTELLDEAFVGISVPGTLDDYASMVSPENGNWSAAHIIMLASFPLSFAMVIFGAMHALALESRAAQRETLVKCLRNLAMIFFGSALLALWFHGVDILVTNVSPGGSDFFHSSEGRAQLALGHAGLLILAAINAGLVAWTGFILFVLHHLPLFIWAFWNLSWGAQCIPNDKVQTMGSVVPTAALMLGIVRFVEAWLFLFAAQLALSAETPREIMTSQFLIFLLLCIAGIVIPLLVYKSYGTAMGMMMSRTAISKANATAASTNSTLNSAVSKRLDPIKRKVGDRASSARESVSTHASNAKRTAMSRAGGVMLDVKYGDGPRNPAARPRSASQNVKMQSASASSSESARTKAKNRMRRDAAIRSRRNRTAANSRQRGD